MRNLLVVSLLLTGPAHGSSTVLVAVTVENDSSTTIGGLQLSACDMNDWTADLLLTAVDPSRALEPGESATLTLPVGRWDIRVLGEDGEPLMTMGPLALTDGLVLTIDY